MVTGRAMNQQVEQVMEKAVLKPLDNLCEQSTRPTQFGSSWPQNFVASPAGSKATSYSFLREVSSLGNLWNSQRAKRRIDVSSALAIDDLLQRGRPSAIVRAVRARTVLSVKSHAARGITHVCIEGKKRVTPLITHLYPLAAISRPSRVVRVVASPDHAFPYRVDASATHPVLDGDTSTALTSARPLLKRTERYRAHSSALALSLEVSSRLFAELPRLVLREDRPSVKLVARGNRIASSHLPNLRKRLVSGQRPRCVSALRGLAHSTLRGLDLRPVIAHFSASNHGCES